MSLSASQLKQFSKTYPKFTADKALLAKIEAHAQFHLIPNNTVICEDGHVSSGLPLLIDGLIRVYKLSENGKEITLYHINKQESCVLTASVILGTKPFPAIAETETDSIVLLIPHNLVKTWLIEHTVWQEFIFELIAQRLTDVISVVEAVAFQRIDKRLAKFIINHNNHQIVNKTHQEIAAELGSAREVITRVLRDFESKKWVKLSRGEILMLNNNLLQQLAES